MTCVYRSTRRFSAAVFRVLVSSNGEVLWRTEIQEVAQTASCRTRLIISAVPLAPLCLESLRRSRHEPCRTATEF